AGGIVARVGDPLAVGRRSRLPVGALARRQLLDVARRDVDAIDVRFTPRILRVLDAESAEHDRLAIRHPARGTVVERSARDLARRPTVVGGEDEDVRVAVLDEPLTVSAVVEL